MLLLYLNGVTFCYTLMYHLHGRPVSSISAPLTAVDIGTSLKDHQILHLLLDQVAESQVK